jgi:hypothetical protein
MLVTPDPYCATQMLSGEVLNLPIEALPRMSYGRTNFRTLAELGNKDVLRLNRTIFRYERRWVWQVRGRLNIYYSD